MQESDTHISTSLLLIGPSMIEPKEYWPEDLLGIIRSILSHKCPCPARPEFAFEMTEEAALKNYFIMKKNNFDLAKALTQQKNSPLGFGSEFKPPSIIEPLFHLHPNWNHVKSILSNGSQWPLEPISEEIRRSNLEEALAFSNHKGATDKPEILKNYATTTSFTDTPWSFLLTRLGL